MLSGSPCSTILKAIQRQKEIIKLIPYSQRWELGGKEESASGLGSLPFHGPYEWILDPLSSPAPQPAQSHAGLLPHLGLPAFSVFSASSCPGQGDPKDASVLCPPHNNSSHQGSHEPSASPSLVPAPWTIISISS